MISIWYSPVDDKFVINMHRHFLLKPCYVNGQNHLLIDIYYYENKKLYSYYIYHKKNNNKKNKIDNNISLGYVIYKFLSLKYGNPAVSKDKRANYLRYKDMH